MQLVMFHEGIRSERELMRIVSDCLSLRWYVGYDLHEPLPDHSSLARIRDRFGLSVFREFFERIVGECVEAGLVWGEALYFDATKVDANASLDSIAPRFYVEEHLGEHFTEEEPLDGQQDEERITVANEWDESLVGVLYERPTDDDVGLAQVQAQEVAEGKHRGAANCLRIEHKEIGSGSGTGSAEVGSGGGLASTGSGEPLQVPSEWAVTFPC